MMSQASRQRPIAIGLIVAVLIGAGLWWLLRGERSAAATPADTARTGVAAPAELEAGASDRDPTSTAARLALTSAPESQPSPAVASGPRVHGRIIDERGVPIAGATIYAREPLRIEQWIDHTLLAPC